MSVRKAALWSAATNYSAFAIQFAVSIIISRFFLTPEELGVFSIAMASALLLAVVQDFGINRYIISQKDVTPELLRTANAIAFLFAWLIALILVLFAETIANYYGDTRIEALIYIVALSFACGPLGLVPVSLLSRDLDFRSIGIINVGAALTNAIVAISLAAAGFSAAALAWGTVASALARGLIGFTFKPVPFPWPVRWQDMRPMMSFGSTASLLSISGAIGVRSTDLILGRFLSLAAVGLYSRAASLTGQLHTLLMGAIGGVFFPAFSKLHHEGKDLAPYYERVVALYGGVVAPVMLLLGAISYPLVSFLYGENWLGVAPILLILTLAELPFLALPLHMDIPIALGRIRTLLFLNIIETIASVSTLIIFSSWGLEWAAWSRLVYGICWVIVYAHFMHSLIKFSWHSMIISYVKSITVAGISILPMILLFKFYAPPSNISILAVAATLLVCPFIWLGSLIVLKHPARSDITELVENILQLVFPKFSLPERLK